jgi:phosphatidylserine/phosphatidylglycerophosphate/cardiolipin synthase-like enzyme
MRRLLLALSLLCAANVAFAGSTVLSKGTIEVAFSPNGGATALVVKTIGEAKKSILVQAYSFTSAPIAQALAQAKSRGVDVRVLLDKSQKSERYTVATYLANHGVPTWIDGQHAIAHNKVMVIDNDTVITGSFNFTKAAEEKNAENVIVLRGNPDLARVFSENWLAHQAHSN